MSRSKEPAASASTPRGFDHHRSDLVDITPNSTGEFVQVWDRPQGERGRRLLLTYQRTPLGPKDISSRLYPNEGPWLLVETTGSRRTFYYRNRPDQVRHELALPGGGWLINDVPDGLVIRSVYAAAFNPEVPEVAPPPLGDKAVMRRQSEGGAWFILSYQETWAAPDTLSSSVLRLVEAYRGHELLRTWEYPLVAGA
jgi:hypothetical protein